MRPSGDDISATSAIGAIGAIGAIDAEPPLLTKGAILGRYVVLESIGRGGMGIVYAAYDPVLDRRVAVKLLRRVSRDDGEQERMLHEGKAMAKLSHANVVTVLDVGTFAQRVFVAMELVEGLTLRAWSRQPRSWRETVAMYLQAGRGLAAAHAAGIVHRDFKPDNVLVGPDDRARVVDFGVAKDLAAPRGADRENVESVQASELATESGDSLIGTPRYMAPEQLAGETVDERADQFAFCASLWESLYGRPPFEGRDILDLLDRVHKEKPRATPGREVPGRVRAVLERGLSVQREARFPRMDDLLAALDRDPSAARRRFAAIAGAALVGGAALFAAGRARAVDHPDPCAHPERDLAGSWDEAAKARIGAAFSGTQRSYASFTTSRVLAILDDYAAQYTAMRGETCAASRDGRGGADLRVLQDACLDGHRQRLHALVNVLGEKPDTAVLDKAVSAALGLPPISDCADVDALAARVRPPDDPAVRARVAAVQGDVDRLEALFAAGKYEEGAAQPRAVLKAASEVGYSHLTAQAQLLVGRLREATGDYEEAKELFHEAATSGAAANDPVLVVNAWAGVLFIAGERQRNTDEARAILGFGPTLLALAHDDVAESKWRSYEGVALYRMGKLAEARAAHERALSLAEKALPPDSPELASVIGNLVLTLTDLGDYPAALETSERGLRIAQQSLGADNPRVGAHLNNLGLLYMQIGDLPRAREKYEAALRVWEGALGPSHQLVGMALDNVADALFESGDWPRALEMHERALEIREKALGPDHPDVAQSLYNVGEVLLEMGEIERATKVLERSLAILEKAMGPDRPELAYPLQALGRAHVRLHQLDVAGRLFDRALGLVDKPDGDKPLLAWTLWGDGELATARGRTRDAVAILERAMSLAVTFVRPRVELALADALWAGQIDRPRARVLAEDARTFYSTTGDARRGEQASRWLGDHPPERLAVLAR